MSGQPNYYDVLNDEESLKATDYDALVETTSIEDMTEDEMNYGILWSLMFDHTFDDADLPRLRLCSDGRLTRRRGDFIPWSSKELGWLGYFVKESVSIKEFGVVGRDIFENCSEESVNIFFHENLGKCNHLKTIRFRETDLSDVIFKLGPVTKNSSITHWTVSICTLGVLEAKHLFNTFREMKILEELYISLSGSNGKCVNGVNSDLDDDIMAGCIPSLATCAGMQTLELNDLNISTNSCAALSAIFPRMAALKKLTLCRNAIDDNCVKDLVRGLVECKHLHSLELNDNNISDNGLDSLVQGLPANVDKLNVEWNDIALARQLSLMRLRVLDLSACTFSPDGPQVIAASLANPECLLEEVYLYETNIGDKGATILAESLHINQRLLMMNVAECNITKTGWNEFLPILCDTTSISATHGSNHTLQCLGEYRVPANVQNILVLNKEQDKSRVAAKKILQTHRHLNMKPLFDWELYLMPHAVGWLERFAEARPDLKMSTIFEFMRAMPMYVVGGVVGIIVL